MTVTKADTVDRIVEAVTAVDGVAGIHPGGPGSPATYLPGRTVQGVRVDDTSAQVAVVLSYDRDTDLVAVADRVRRAASDAAGLPVDVVVADIAVAGPPEASTSSKEFSS